MMIGMARFTGKTRRTMKDRGTFYHLRTRDNSIVLLDDETMETTIEVDVDELCTTTVARRPSINPAIGLESIASSVKSLPVILPKRRWNAKINTMFREEKCLPASKRKDELITSNEHTNK